MWLRNRSFFAINFTASIKSPAASPPQKPKLFDKDPRDQVHKIRRLAPIESDIHTSFLAIQVHFAKEIVLNEGPTEHFPAVHEFRIAIEGDTVVKDLFNQIFLHVSEKKTVNESLMLQNIITKAY